MSKAANYQATTYSNKMLKKNTASQVNLANSSTLNAKENLQKS